jgi:hypothetical protein
MMSRLFTPLQIQHRLVKKLEAKESTNDGEDVHICRYGGSDVCSNKKW